MEPADHAGPHRCAVCRLDATKPALVATIDRTPVAVLCDRHGEGKPPGPGATSYGALAPRRAVCRHVRRRRVPDLRRRAGRPAPRATRRGMTMMEPTDRAGLHWQPLAATEREALFDQVDAFLASRPPIRPDEPIRRPGDCPSCGHPGDLFRRH